MAPIIFSQNLAFLVPSERLILPFQLIKDCSGHHNDLSQLEAGREKKIYINIFPNSFTKELANDYTRFTII